MAELLGELPGKLLGKAGGRLTGAVVPYSRQAAGVNWVSCGVIWKDVSGELPGKSCIDAVGLLAWHIHLVLELPAGLPGAS